MTTTPASSHTSLIASDRVEGAAVYDRQGQKLGSIHNFMVDKRTGTVEYANMSFGGIFGMGGLVHQLRWDALNYVPDRNGYVVDLDKATLEQALAHERESTRSFDGGDNQSVTEYYGIPLQ